MQIDGGCLCGAITYAAKIDPARVIICHCSDCQINSATAFRYGALVRREDFQLLTGAPRTYLKTAESGMQRVLAFCSDCGTSLYGGDAVEPQFYSLRLGTCRQRAALVPRLQIWRRSALPWVTEIASIPSFEAQPNVADLVADAGSSISA